MANLIALVADHLRGDPRLNALNIPAWTWLNRAAARFARTMVRIAANRPTRRRLSNPDHPRPARPPQDAERAAALRLPTTQAWLIRAIPFKAAAIRCQLEYLCAEPGVPEFLAAHPELGRVLRPLGRMLGIDALVPRRTRPKPATSEAATPDATTPAAAPGPARKRTPRPRFTSEPLHPDPDYRPSAKWPAACLRRFKPA
jgi:hypothetical protein